MQKVLILFTLFIPLIGYTQLIDDFEDGDFSSNPTWTGNTGSFIINGDNQLQLDTIGSATKFLLTANNSITDTEWNFWCKLNFDPSANNQLKVYLASDKQDFTKALNGYFINIGENLAQDGIDLYKQEGLTETLLIAGINGHAAKKPEIRIKVLHKKDGMWELYVDTLGNKNFVLEGSAIDTAIKTSNYFGVYCKYTSSNANDFYFDDFYIGGEQIDTIGPKAVETDFLTKSTFQIQFDEDFLQDSVDVSDFSLIALTSPTYTTYLISQVQILSSNTLLLDISPETFLSYIPIMFSYKIYDKIGNLNSSGGIRIFNGLNFKDIVINEIMPDPSPANKLPEAEFIELDNITNSTINLEDFIIADQSKQTVLPDFKLEPDKYVILCNHQDTSLFSPFGEVIGISLPSLNNTSDIITLRDKYETLVDSISYSDNWYKDDIKKEGGWSLELINPKENCLFDKYNWTASIDKNGGTPGDENSNYDQTFGFNPPQIVTLSTISDCVVQITANKKLRDIDDISLTTCHITSLTNIQENINFISKSQPATNTYEFTCNKTLEKNSIYHIQIAHLMDCNNYNTVLDTQLAIPVNADSANLVINEILFNPYPNSYDFVEIYNRSKNIIDLKTIKIASFDDSMQIKNVNSISAKTKILYPEEYLVISENTSDIESQYLCKYPDRLFQTKLPSFSDDEGIVALLDQNNQVIDMFHYSSDMHFALLDDDEGVSMERVSFEEKTANPSNWHSAASSYGYATPTYQNSQFSETSVGEKELWLDPKVFSPDGDGYNDVLFINYAFQNADNFGRIRIYDIGGRLIKTLVNNDLFGLDGFYSWDGINDHGELSPSGVYIIVAEINNLDGSTFKYKRTCTLAKFQ
ncbi:MAG: hypothetical protein HN431_08935 [Bacteroidetes bacterium]|nr:hypothetical protein [Bacteroidota bacterium]